MKTLILMRHGKSDWSGDVADHARPINARGREASRQMARWLREAGYAPDQALISTAARTRETWARMCETLDPAPPAMFRDDLYLAEPDAILAAIREGASGESVLVLGHNPGLEAAAALLGRDGAFTPMPTAAAAVLRFDIGRWDEAAYGTGTAAAFQRPKALTSRTERKRADGH